MELLILGYHPTEYLETVASYLNQCGIYCYIEKTAIDDYTISIDDYSQHVFEVNCICQEWNPSNIVKKIENLSTDRLNISHVIHISHIKWFSEFRYNVDENWKEMDKWVSWDVIQKKTRSAFPSANIGWVLFGAEKISLCSQFFQGKDNDIALRLSLPVLYDIDMPALMQRFLVEIGEENFCQSIKEHNDIVGFMFSLFPEADEICISEKANIYRTLYTFLQASGAECKLLYDSLFRL